jgi:hypothetical protein
MKKPIKAALLSGLVFPGLGHLVVKAYWRATALIVTALAATAEIFNIAMKEALAVVDSINSGNVPTDADSLSALMAQSASGPDNTISNLCLIVLGVCWLIGIVDSYRLGKVLEP